ncbi:MAG: DNA gyrase subunit A [Clostridia bacterium]|nr:DNA gyrase subunit A [Clostridia bacterium]MBR3195284.1 DNA gyrase subunit A [Clostridia bacterium]
MEITSGGRIINVNLEREMKESFIAYAMAVIINRALPDVRDGLKPVHRRILFSMGELGITPDKPFRKSARIVGDVLGKYHPHGDSSVYDAMVRLAQDFSMRYPLVEGHGNFGSVDGDGAAAMRYTEARLSKLAMEMLSDIDKDTVDFMPNFDNTAMQPTVLPSRFPNLLVNGAGGIAVGMATNIPPHNLREVINGVLALADNPDITNDELMRLIPGPDFPTGGIIMGTSGIREAYRTGRGKIVVRAKTDVEQMAGNRQRIVVTEIPYQVNKARLIEKIAELATSKRIEGISDLRDESDREGMRIVIELGRNVNAQVVLNQLFKHTQLQDTFGANMLALVNGEPKVLDLKSLLYHYLEYQKEIITRRTRFDLEKAEARAHIIEGLLIALDNIDEIVALIRASKTTQEAKDALMTRFGLSERQAQAILDMRLQRLVGMERDRLETEMAALQEKIAYYRAVLSNESMVLDIIREEIRVIMEKYGDDRRTEIAPLEDEIDIEDLVEEKEVVVTMTHFNYVKRCASDTYRAQNRGGRGVTALSTREEDFIEKIFTTSTHQEIMFFTNTGRMFRLKGYQIPEGGRTARGSAIVNLLMLDGEEKITACFPLPKMEVEEYEKSMLVMVTKQGLIKKTPLAEFKNIRKSGIRALTLRDEDMLVGVQLTNGSDDLIFATKNGQCVRFNETKVRPMGRTAAGVRAVKLKEGDYVIAFEKVVPDKKVLVVSENAYGKRTDESDYPAHNRGGSGVKTLTVNEKTGKLAGMTFVGDDEDVMLINSDGTIIRIEAATISEYSRTAQGVRLMRLQDDATVVSIATTLHAAEEESAEPAAAEETAEE